MTSATANTSRSAGGHRGARQGGGLIFFACVLLLVVGFFNIIEGISAIANSHIFTANAHYVFANLRTWGWITLIIGVLQLIAAGGIVTGNQLARWFAVAVAMPGTFRRCSWLEPSNRSVESSWPRLLARCPCHLFHGKRRNSCRTCLSPSSRRR